MTKFGHGNQLVPFLHEKLVDRIGKLVDAKDLYYYLDKNRIRPVREPNVMDQMDPSRQATSKLRPTSKASATRSKVFNVGFAFCGSSILA